MEGALSTYDALLSPAAPTAAYRLGDKVDDPLAMYKGERVLRCLHWAPPSHTHPLPPHTHTPLSGDLMTVNVNLAGLPALVVPCGFTEEGGTRLPVGLQVRGGGRGLGSLGRPRAGACHPTPPPSHPPHTPTPSKHTHPHARWWGARLARPTCCS